MGNCFGVHFLGDAIKNLRLLRIRNGSVGEEDKENQAFLIDVPDEAQDDVEEILWKGRENESKNHYSTVVTSVCHTNQDLGIGDFLHLSHLNETNAFGARWDNQLYDFANQRGVTRHYLNFWIKPNVVEECFVPLSVEDEAMVRGALSLSRSLDVLVTHDNSNIEITGEKLQCLKPMTWLNDEIINLYFVLLKERENRDSKKFLKCHFFNTYFFKKLIFGSGHNFESLRRWTTLKKLGYCLSDCEKIFVPVHRGAHWSLAIININDKKFQYLDSFNGDDGGVLDLLAYYYVMEIKDKSGVDLDLAKWTKEICKDIPQQKNGYDCGMFMIKYADFYSRRDVDLCFNQGHISYFRKRTVKEILKLRAE